MRELGWWGNEEAGVRGKGVRVIEFARPGLAKYIIFYPTDNLKDNSIFR